MMKLDNYEDLIKHKETEGRGSQPHVLVVKPGRSSKGQLTVHTTIGEGLSRLDLAGAVRDLHRFGYVCKMLEHLIEHKLSSMSGAGQKAVFILLKDVLAQVLKTHNNVNTVKRLLSKTETALREGRYDHLGSAQLWEKHEAAVLEMQDALSQLQLKEREEDGGATMSDLPDEVLRQILFCLDDHTDVIRTGLTEWRALGLTQEVTVWRRLCQFHFGNKPWNVVVRKGESLESLGWKKLYVRLVKRYGQREVFAEGLALCNHCNALFWEHHGHPCLFANLPPKVMTLTPVMCVELFMS